MTVASETSSIPYAGDGVTLAFSIPFNFLANSDIQVSTRDSAGDTTILSTGYSITGAGTGSGTCTFTVAPAVGTTVVLERDPDILQPIDLVSNDRFPAETIETGYDRLTFIAQKLYQLFQRAIRFPAGDAQAGSAAELADVSARKGTYLYFDAVTGAISYAVNLAVTTLTQAVIGGVLYPRTAAETAAGVFPTRLYIADHTAIGVVLTERYGGAGDNSTLNDTALSNALKVAYQMGDGVVVYGGGSAGIWKFSAAATIGAANQGRRVVGYGRVEWDFSAAISSGSDLVTLSADLNSAYKDQPQFDNIQVKCNRGGRDGVVLTVGNRPLVRNIRVINAARDSYVESVTGTNWIEKADVSVISLSAGRNAFRQEILGTAGQNPYINKGTYFLEARGVSAVTAGGKALHWTGSAGLGAAAKISGNHYTTLFDAIYNAAAAVPSTSPVVADTVLVDNPMFLMPEWENTGTGGNPGAGPLIKVNSGTLAYVTIVAPNWNSFWGDGTLDAAITGVNRIADRSFPANNTQYGKLSLKGNVDNQTILDLKGQTTAGTAADLAITRTAAAVNAIGQGSCVIIGNSTTSTFACVQEYSGELVIYTFSGGSWGERFRVLPTGGIRIANGAAQYSVTGGAPSGGTGSNGDFAFRTDGGAGTSIYMKRGGAWVGIV